MARAASAGALALALGLASSVATAEEQVVSDLLEPFHGDFDAMVERRRIRALVAYSKTFYFLDGPTPRGLAYEMLRAFQEHVNRSLETRHLRVDVTIVPVRRDQLLPFLEQGKGDLAVGNLTVTPERRQRVAFSEPMLTGVDEVLVTGSGVDAPSSVSGLSGMTVHVRRSSSYFASLTTLNARLEAEALPPVHLRLVDESLEDEDLLEMMNAGLIPAVIMDSHKAEFWASVFPDVAVHPDVAVRRDAEIAWALRHDSPDLLRVVNEFVRGHRKGTTIGNVLFRRYLETNRWIRNPLTTEAMRRFQEVQVVFRKYADRYDFDPLLLAALAYQESGLDHSKRSAHGAVGIMQILPSTARDPNVKVANIEKRANNIHAGVKYLRFLIDRYFSDPGIDRLNRTLLAFAAYNAGPGRVAELRSQAALEGLDPDAWFDNVELVAARSIGRETVRYVSNIYKYYVAYRLARERLEEKGEALEKRVEVAPTRERRG